MKLKGVWELSSHQAIWYQNISDFYFVIENMNSPLCAVNKGDNYDFEKKIRI